MKRPKLRITGIEEGEETQVKGSENIFNKIIEENFPNLKKVTIKVQKAYRTRLLYLKKNPKTNKQKKVEVYLVKYKEVYGD